MKGIRLVLWPLFAAALLGAGCRPTADFSVDKTEGLAPLSVQFTDTSKVRTEIFGINLSSYYPVTRWQWTFGDGGGSTQQHPQHTYEYGGRFNVTLTVWNRFGSDFKTVAQQINVATQPPIANFTADATRGPVPFTVRFTDQSVAGSSPINAYRWDFGDGGGSTERNPQHTYLIPGTYSVRLTVTSNSGSNSRLQSGLITATVGTPVASFVAAPREGHAPLDVQFTDTSIAGSAAIVQWRWDFGDGATSTLANPRHVYGAAGTYTVKLRISNTLGESEKVETGYIVVLPPLVPPRAGFSFQVDPVNPLLIRFTDVSAPGSHPITLRVWDFGDGTTSTEQNPAHLFPAPGRYVVSLTVTTIAGSNSSINPSFPVGL